MTERYADKLFKLISENPVLLQNYNEGVDALEKSRVIEFLRAAYVPVLHEQGANPHKNAAQGAFSAGYNKALDDLLMFNDAVLEHHKRRSGETVPDFNGEELAIQRNYLNKEEIDADRRGIKPKYDPRTGLLTNGKPE